MADKGIYALVINLPGGGLIDTGKKRFELDAGWYAYIGSALNGLGARVTRHLRAEKRKHWHIDYLLEKGVISDVVSAETDARLECAVAAGLAGFPGIPGFGATDCRCRSHLFFSRERDDLERRVCGVFENTGLEPLIRRCPDLP